MLWRLARRGLIAFLAALLAVAWVVPAAGQIPTSPGQRLAPTNDSEQHLSDLSVEAATALGTARAAAAHCNPAGLADAVKQLQQLEQESRQAASIAKGAGAMSAVRPEFANSIHDTIAGELRDASALKPNCPQPNPPQAQVPGGNANPPPPPPPPPPVQQPPAVGGFLGPNIRVGPPDALDALEDEADDTVDDFWDAVDHCSADGMKRALDHLRDLGKEARDMARTAKAAGKFTNFTAADIQEMKDLASDIDSFILDSASVKPKCPLPEQPKSQTGSSCPSTPQLPRESLLNQPLKLNFGYTPRLTGTLYSNEILDYHNALRSEFGSQPLQWNPMLAMHAADYAKTMTETGQLVHSPRTGREGERENLNLSRHGANSLQGMLDTWGMEMRYYRPGVFPNISSDGNWMSAAHYTQMIWPTATRIGCGFYAGARYDALVCRYSPPGNTDGKPLIPSNPCWRQFALPPPPPPP